VDLDNLVSESETCVGSRVHLVGVSISFEKNIYRLPFTPPLSGSLYRSFRSCQPTSTMAAHGRELTPKKEIKLRSRTRSTNMTRRAIWRYCEAPNTSWRYGTTTSASSMSATSFSDGFKAARTILSCHHLGRGLSSSTKCSDQGHTRSSTKTGGSHQRMEHRTPAPVLSFSK
jgi:hypothetical protein